MQEKLSKLGPEFSRIILGLWRITDKNLDIKEIENIIKISIDSGIDTFDEADIYGDYRSQELFGEVLKRNKNLRQEIKIISKGNIQLVSEKRPGNWIKHYDSSKKYLVDSVNKTLKQLNTDYLDLFLLHRWDPLINPHEIMDTFVALKDAGKVKHFGVSNFLPEQFNLIDSKLLIPLVTNQIEVSVLNTEAFENGMLTQCLHKRIHPLAWSPLGGGELLDPTTKKAITVNETIEKLTKKYNNVSITQIALAWLLKHPAKIHPIIGTLNPERIKDAVSALKLDLDLQDWYSIYEASNGNPVP